MKIRSPMRAGDTPHGEFGQLLLPHPDSDGYFGGAKAVVFNSGNACGNSASAQTPAQACWRPGGLVFYGSWDRPFYAVNQLTGDTLWSVRLNGVPSAGPISFTAGDAAFPVKPMCTGADRAAATPCLAAIELGNQLQQAVIERIESALT